LSIFGSYNSGRGVDDSSRNEVVVDEVGVSLVGEGNYVSFGVV